MKIFSYLLVSIALVSCQEAKKTNEETALEKAQRIHKKTITLDTHADINTKNFTDSVNYTQRLETQVNLPKMQEGGLDAVWLIVYTGQDSLTEAGYAKAKENAMDKFAAIRRLCEVYAPDKIGLATTSEEVRRLDAEGKKVAMIGVENAYPIGEDLSAFKDYYNMGARYISLSHNGHSQFCDSNTGELDSVWLHNGLSDLGKKAIEEMNKLGMMIDVSHPSKLAMEQMVALSKAPIIASHSSARALCNHSRNLDDDQLRLMKQNGGVVQTVAFSSYLNTEKHEARAAYMKNIYGRVADSLGVQWLERSEVNALAPVEKETYLTHRKTIMTTSETLAAKDASAPIGVTVSDFVDHIDYMVKLIGIDHVGISSDFDGGGGIVGWQDASETFNVTQELVSRNYTETEIDKLWSGNLLRVLDEVQAVAKTLQ